MVEHRADELLAALETFVSLHTTNLPELEEQGIGFVGQLDIHEIHYMGHSFGASTILHAAYSRQRRRRGDSDDEIDGQFSISNNNQKSKLMMTSPALRRHSVQLPQPATLIAHDPVSDWLPDDTRHSLFEKQRLQGSRFLEEFKGFTGDDDETVAERAKNHDKDETTNDNNNNNNNEAATTAATATITSSSSSIHDFHILVLSSHEWFTKQLEASHILFDMHERGQFGARPKMEGEKHGSSSSAETAETAAPASISHVKVIDQAFHNEFSDTCMLTPLWIARASKITGLRNPIHTAEEIHQDTLAFLQAWRRVHKK
jgi:pimeloyl-ACP methyl ester carboxylesterase